MSTTKDYKDKKKSENWKYVKGGKNEEPATFDFSNERNLRAKKAKGYDTHYHYTDEEGNTAFIVEKQYTDSSEQKKKFILHSKWKNAVNGQQRWMAAKAPEPRCIYNLPAITAQNKVNKVVIAEGEKAADAYAKRKLYPITTWSCGCYCVLKNDWTPLVDVQDIILFPDNDQLGFNAMHKLAMHLHKDLGIELDRIKWVAIPEDFPEHWDLGDDVPKNSDIDAHTLIAGAASYPEVIENYKEIWNELEVTKLKKEVDITKAERLLEKGEDLIYIEELDEFLDLKKDKLIPIKHFDHNYLYLKVKSENPSTFLLKQEDFKRAYTFEYNPKRPTGIVEVDGVTRANRYKKPNIVGKVGDIKHWKENLENLCEDEDRAHQNEQYFAWCFQNQGDKANWTPLWISVARGIGKNYVTRILTECYGLKNIRPNLKYKNVVGKFNSWIIGAQFAVVNEIFISKNYNKKMEMSEEIKDLITEPYIHIEEKFRRGFDYPNTCNFILISNHEDCMNIDNGERRYYVQKLSDKIRTREYWLPKWDWVLKEDGAAIVYKHLMELKIDDADMYKDRAPVTEDMKELAAGADHPIHKWLDEHRAAESGPFRRQGSSDWKVFNYMVVAVDLHRAITAGFKQESALDTVIDWCKKYGHDWKNGKTKTRQIRLSNGERPRAYLLPPLRDPEADPANPSKARDYWCEFLRSKTDTELGAIYETKGKFKSNF
jgi:hypothetical protein